MDNEEAFFKNNGLYDIVAFIGQKSSNKKNLSSRDAYKAGKKAINSRLNKWHMTALERLVIADQKTYALNYEDKNTIPVWKIHRNKAKKVFKAIRDILDENALSDVIALFNDICTRFGFDSGDYAAGSPYYSVIKDLPTLISENYDYTDICDLKKCADKIELFSKFHKT